MKGLEHVTTYMIIPALIFIGVYLTVFNKVLDSYINVSKGILAYADCANEMMNYAFTNPTQNFNFTECYNNKLKNITLYCNYTNFTVECNYNGEKYFYRLG